MYRDAQETYSLHILLAPIYIPLAFGLIWPVLIAFQTLSVPLVRRISVRRQWIAILIFVWSFCCSVYFVRPEYRSLTTLREHARASQLWQAQWRAQQLEEQRQAEQLLGAGGITALTDPLTGPQFDALKSCIDNNSVPSLDLRNAIEHYRTSTSLLGHLAAQNSCPPEVLETIFKIALSLQSHPPPSNGVEVWDVLHTMAFNPNTPVPLLIQLLQNENSSVRIAVAVSPRLPKSEKVAYLKRASASPDFSERRLVAQDPDTPEELLKQLALDPINAEDVARNPKYANSRT
ncbi:MAG TPA: hypothetical protein VGI46_12715 [Candidatus Acidoferrum sp.]